MKQKMKNSKLEKRILQIVIIVTSITILVLSLITLASTVKSSSNLAFGKYSFYIMKSTSQPEIAKSGDLVITERTKSGDVKSGDKVVYKDNQFYYCDSVKEVKKVNTINKLIIAEKDGVSYQFSEYDVKGRIIKTVRNWGSIIAFIKTPLGTVLLFAFIVCIGATGVTLSKYKRNN